MARLVWCMVLVSIASASCYADEPVLIPKPDPLNDADPLVIFPTNKLPDIAPTPLPSTVDPRTITTLASDEIYAVQSMVPLVLRKFGDGEIKTLATDGPKIFPGKFAGNHGVLEVGEFKLPFLYFITVAKPGLVEIDFLPPCLTTETESKIVRKTLTLTELPQPPPKPEPKPLPVQPEPEPTPPAPGPTPEPITPSKLQVVILEEPQLRATLPSEQIAVMDGAEVRGYCKTHCVITNGTPDFRVYSVRQDVSNQPQWIKDAFDEPRSSVPFIVILTPTKTISGPLPVTILETMDLLRTYGGP